MCDDEFSCMIWFVCVVVFGVFLHRFCLVVEIDEFGVCWFGLK